MHQINQQIIANYSFLCPSISIFFLERSVASCIRNQWVP